MQNSLLTSSQHQTLELAKDLALAGFHEALRCQYENPEPYETMDFADRLQEVMTAQLDFQHHTTCQRLRKNAGFMDFLPLEQIVINEERGISTKLMTRIKSMGWVLHKETLIVSGASGTGKTALCCAIGLELCKRQMSVKYVRCHDFLYDYRNRAQKGKINLRRALKKIKCLILDDFGLNNFSSEDVVNLLDIINDRYGVGVMVIGTQLTYDGILELMKQCGTGANGDAIIDRITRPMHLISLKGESMRGRYSHDLEAKQVENWS